MELQREAPWLELHAVAMQVGQLMMGSDVASTVI
jgi:hypothetical protein